MRCLLAAILFLAAVPALAVTLKINGSTTVNPVVEDASEVFRARGLKVFVDTQGGSSGGISYLAEGMADIAMSSRPISERDRQKYPGINFVSHTIGYDGVALVVSRNLYEAGVTRLTKAQIKDLYEGKIKNWRDVGGPDRRVVFFNKEPGRGTWEVFAKYLYKKVKHAPKVFHPEVGANQEARTKIAGHHGGITQLSASWAWNHDKVRAIEIVEDGKAIAANFDNIASGAYPMRRPLLVITNGQPKNASADIVKYLRSAAGQRLVKKHGYLTISKKSS